MEHDGKDGLPALAKNISMTMTPMVFTARMMKQKDPTARMCFIGPCAAKKLEASRRTVRSDVDFVLTFEELAGIMEGRISTSTLWRSMRTKPLCAPLPQRAAALPSPAALPRPLPTRSRSGTPIWTSRSRPHRVWLSARSCC